MPTATAHPTHPTDVMHATSRITCQIYTPSQRQPDGPSLATPFLDLPTTYAGHGLAWRQLAAEVALAAEPLQVALRAAMQTVSANISLQLFRLIQDYTGTFKARPGRGQLVTSTETTVLPQAISDRLRQLAQLPANWDGEGASPPSQWALALAWTALRQLQQVLPAAVDRLAVVPAINGGIRLEWMAQGREVTVIIPPDEHGMVEVYRYSETPLLEEDVEERTLARLPQLVEWFHAR